MTTIKEYLHSISVYNDAVSVTPNDSTDIAKTRALSVGANGTVQVDTASGSVTTISMIAGEIYPLAVTRVYATGTTATGIVAYY